MSCFLSLQFVPQHNDDPFHVLAKHVIRFLCDTMPNKCMRCWCFHCNLIHIFNLTYISIINSCFDFFFFFVGFVFSTKVEDKKDDCWTVQTNYMLGIRLVCISLHIRWYKKKYHKYPTRILMITFNLSFFMSLRLLQGIVIQCVKMVKQFWIIEHPFSDFWCFSPTILLCKDDTYF